MSRDDLPGRIAALQCESLALCCKGQSLTFDAATCKSLLTSELRFEIQEQSVPKTAYDEQAAADCVADVGASIVCGDIKGDSPACERLFVGTLPRGAACSDSRECLDPEGGAAFCDGGVCSVLQAPVHGKLGDICSFSCRDNEHDCSDYPGQVAVVAVACFYREGLHCGPLDPLSNTATCQPPAALGQPCSEQLDCVAGAVCSYGGTCIEPKANGAGCSGGVECQSGHCDGIFCSAMPSVNPRDCSPD